MACEAAAEVAFSEAYVRAGVAHLERPVGRFLNGFNLATDRIRGLYNALSGEAVEGLPFWPAFAASSDRRNAIMHKGARATHSEAEASLQAGEALVAHLGDVGGRQPAA